MPYIAVNTAGTLTNEQKNEIKTRLGTLIEILPGKSEKGLMVDISDGHSMFMAGAEKENAAFLDIRLYKESPFDEKARFISEVCAMLGEVAGIDTASVYCNYLELPIWASRGNLR